MSFRALDLFCGAGGLTRGLVDAGFEIAGAVDSWAPAVRSYQATFPGHRALCADVATISLRTLERQGISGPIDLVVGGPPCQGFSIQRIGEDIDGRNDLVLQFGRVVSGIRPQMFMMENVPGLLGHRGKATFSEFVRRMTIAGYHINHAILDALGFGIPQNRKRVFVVGRLGDARPFEFPVPQGRALTVQDAIEDLQEPPVDFTCDPNDPLHRRMRLSDLNLARLRMIPPGGGFEDLPTDMRVDCHKAGAAKIGHRSVYGRLRADQPAGTITARFDSFTRGRFAHPSQDRNITLREGARLQGFPDAHKFLGTQEEVAAQIGNAIPPPLAKAMAIAITRHLENGRATARPIHVSARPRLTSAA